MSMSTLPTGGAKFDARWGTFCQRCGVEAPTKAVVFRQNIGAFVIRFNSQIGGELCKSCIHAFYNYATAATLPPPSPGARTDDNDPVVMRRLAKSVQGVAQRLNAGESVEQVLPDLCRAAQATPGQGRVFLRMITRGKLR